MLNTIETIPFDKDEKFIYALNKEYYDYYIANGFDNNNFFVAITDKRLYFRGAKNNLKNDFVRLDTIDLRNITGVKILKHSYPILLIAGAFFSILSLCLGLLYKDSSQITELRLLIALLTVLGLALIISYIITITRQMAICFSGNSTSFSIKDFKTEAVLEFQKQLLLAKEKAINIQNGGNKNETSA